MCRPSISSDCLDPCCSRTAAAAAAAAHALVSICSAPCCSFSSSAEHTAIYTPRRLLAVLAQILPSVAAAAVPGALHPRQGHWWLLRFISLAYWSHNKAFVLPSACSGSYP
uniref:Uncharacterized protein n=1 Tax=Dunaliella tertiolecta TaxID=3047 RepID=A0A7S3QTG0_DUNTE|eukprot:214435-Pelagomonas_calceolata.AAC.4